ncbi:histidine kinase [Sphingomonas koreensis]|nr:histidine kinase [Sphingomonas koreensis]
MFVAFFGRSPSSNTFVRRLLFAAMVIGFAALIAAGGAAAWLVSQNQAHIAAVNHTYEVEQQVADLRIAIERAETARRGYIVDSSPRFIATYQTMAARILPSLDRLQRLTADNPSEQSRIATLRTLTAHVAELSARSNELVASRRLGTAARLFHTDDSVDTLQRIRAITMDMTNAEHALLQLRNQRQRASVRTFYIVLAGAGALLVLVALLSLVTVLRYTRDLVAATDSLRDLADSLEDAVEERTADLSRANEEIQRFAYIVSHDLRSPLVNVMGFTAELDAAAKVIADLIARAETEAPDLLTDDARLAANEDLPEAIGFIRTSTQKMDALINAILKLSREGRRVIAPEPLKMDALVENIRDTLQHRLDERDATLLVTHPLPEIVSDRLAIDQIFSNLIENAVKYLQPGRPGRIEVRGHKQQGRAIFEIEDNGRGIDPRDHQRVFDLFRRSGTQDQPGEGIGLAHVRALAYRLGGIIDVSSELGKGATFRLSLPTHYTKPQDEPK